MDITAELQGHSVCASSPAKPALLQAALLSRRQRAGGRRAGRTGGHQVADPLPVFAVKFLTTMWRYIAAAAVS